MSRIRSSFVVLLAVAGLVLALDYATFAATGGSLILGRSNSADRTTALTNSGSGPALLLRNRAGQPPLAVSSKGRVANLNADTVDGRHAGDLANVVRRYSFTPPPATQYNSGKTWTLPDELPRGDYLVTVGAAFSLPFGSASSVTSSQCRARLGAGPDFGGQMVPYAGGYDVLLSFTGLARVTPAGGAPLFVTCDASAGGLTLVAPLVVTVSPVDVLSAQGLLQVN